MPTTEEALDGLLDYALRLHGDGAKRFDLDVQVFVLNACIGGMVLAQEQEDFDKVNRVLAWAHAFCLTNARLAMQAASPEAVQDMKAMLDRAGPLEARPGVKLSSGALTVEELAALGIVDE